MYRTMNLKFINAKQAGEVYEYKNTKQKLHRTIAAIWYNKSGRDRNIKPNYVSIRIKGNNKQCKNTMKTGTSSWRFIQVIVDDVRNHEPEITYMHVPSNCVIF
jgi:hypothetical protein